MPVPLVDSFGRQVTDLRVSVTDRCNLRCTYCMPEEGVPWLPREEILTFEEIERVVRVLVERHGLRSVRLTGGEPTVRAHLPSLVAKLAGLDVELALTTNAMSLALLADDLVAAGLQRINISLDTLRPERFRELTRRDGLERVVDGIAAAVDAGLDPVKINVVLMRGVNDDEIVDFVRFGRDRRVEIRFIEFMPLDAGGTWADGSVVTAGEILSVIEAEHPLVPEQRGSEPAERFAYADGAGHVGVIASVTRPFCASCDRIRLTADGQLRTCLFSIEETDLRAQLRGGADDDAVAAAVATAVAGKWAGHSIGQETFVQPPRPMSRIGG